VDEPKGRLKIALLDHGPNYNAEPLALERLARLAGHLDRIEVKVLEPVSIEDLEPSGVDLAVWTGQHSFKLTDAQRQVLGKYAEAGGTLLVTPLGGDREFYLDARKAVDDIFEPINVMPLPMSHPILAESGIEKLAYRGAAQRAGTSMRMVAGAHGPSALLTNQDILAGLVGYPSGKIDGYAPASAVSLMRGVLTHLAKSR
jgi:hypothetical protein